jgi:hypothetical protein
VPTWDISLAVIAPSLVLLPLTAMNKKAEVEDDVDGIS